MFDIKIINGTLYDGSGSEGVAAGLAVRNGCIAEIGDLSKAEAHTVIDAAGHIVCPGFIDAHSHSDAYLLIEPSAASKTFQGVTTEITGNCGASAAPIMGSYRIPSDWASKTFPGKWKSFAEYRALFEQTCPAVNAAMLIGHNTLHAGVCGYDPRGATPDELRHMKYVLEKTLDEGAIGLSSGLLYPPGSAVPADELTKLAGVVARRDGIYTTHMRNEGTGLIAAIDETLAITRASGVRTQISHLKTGNRKAWHLLDDALARIESARAQGFDLAADRYPYTAGCTDLDVVLPRWASHGGRDAILARVRDPETRRKIYAELRAERTDEEWGHVMIGSTIHPDHENFKGKYLLDVAREIGADPVETILQLIDKDDLMTGGIFFGMSEENMWRILEQPWVMPGSDASLRAPAGPLAADHPHPRAYGSFTRFLRAALDKKTVALPEAIRKMTALPARQFRLKNRGMLKKGYYADIAVFDPAQIKENTTYADPHRLSGGLQHLFVNGTPTITDGRQTGLRNGQLL